MKKKRYEKKHNVIWSKIFIFMWISWSYVLFLVISDFHEKERSYKKERTEKKRKDEEIEKENLKKCKKRKEKNS